MPELRVNKSVPVFQRLTLIGIGLIGSSVARIARERGDLAVEVVVTDSSAAVLERVAVLGFADRIEPDLARAVAGADGVMLCAPVGAYAGIAAAIAPHLTPGAIVTDVGSTKISVIRDVGPLLPDSVQFVPGHPLAGTEYSGPDAGFTTLFRDAGACSPRPRAPIPRQRSGWRSFGGGRAAWSR
jgi:cyclohexadieny/prephenate dehydrogenase